MTDSPIMLKQAIPYIRMYKGKVFVVKVGGRVVAKRETLDALVEDVSLLQQVGIRVVLVHGGGNQATELAKKLGLEPEFVAGRRITDAQMLEVAKMTYAGTLNIDILSSFRAHHTPAVGVSGVDGGLITAVKRPKRSMEKNPGEAPVEVDFGFVGDIQDVDPKMLINLLDAGMTPVISCLGCDPEGVILNINADSIAEAVARALKAEKLVIVTDTEGLLEDVNNPSSLVSYTDVDEVMSLKKQGRLTGGMLPKADACVKALQGGVRRTHIINGLKPGALLREIFTNAGCGTMIVEKRERQAYQQVELAPAEAAAA
ncbi:MAG TPA: acetylglutamate kinase [Elusimicrobiota bacterium]|nr:acetylglutamate kinase [Elusimicrobiota bacterium]